MISKVATKFVLALSLTLGGTQAAQATVVTFAELSPDTTYNSPLTSGGLIFTNSGDGTNVDSFYAIGDGSNGTTTLAPNFYGSSTTIRAVGGTSFTLTSFDFSDAFDFADDPIQVNLTFSTLSGTITRTVFADFNFGMQTAVFNIAGITSFSFFTSGSDFGEDTIQLDNINYTAGAGVVPEPATWMLMMTGFGLVGGAMRRRRTAVAAIA